VDLHEFRPAFPIVSAALRPADAPLIGEQAGAQILEAAAPTPMLLEGPDLAPVFLRVRRHLPDLLGVPVAVDGQGVIDQRVVVIKGWVRRCVHAGSALFGH